MSKLVTSSIQHPSSGVPNLVLNADGTVDGPSLFAGIGSNVVQVVKTDVFDASVASGAETQVTGLSATITPTKDDSKVLVIVHVVVGTSNGDLSRGVGIVLKRDTTAVGIGTPVGNRPGQNAGGIATTGGAGGNSTVAFTFLDSPGVNTATTYNVFARQNMEATSTIYVNRTGTDTDSNFYPRSASSITLIEVAA
jgi:hypothetical protein